MSILKKKKSNKKTVGLLGAAVVGVGAVAAAFLSDKKNRTKAKRTVAAARRKAEASVKKLEARLTAKKASPKTARKVKVVRKKK